MLNVKAMSRICPACVTWLACPSSLNRPEPSSPGCNGLDFYGRPSWANEGVPGCPDPIGSNEYNGRYIGHDEPNVVFYSDKLHSASNLRWEFVLPREHAPPATQSFQNFTAFWFGLAICDPNAYPFGPCTPGKRQQRSDAGRSGDAGVSVLSAGKRHEPRPVLMQHRSMVRGGQYLQLPL